jgi:predicted nucleic acid-binding protein
MDQTVDKALQDIEHLDAMQLAAAYIAGSKVFVTNDKQLKNVKEMEVLILDDFN